MSQAEFQGWQVNRLCDTRNWIGTFRPQTAPNHHHHQYWHKCDGKDRGGADRQGLGPCQWSEHAPFLRFEQKDRHKGNNDDDQGKEERRANLFGCVDKNGVPLRFQYGAGIVFLPFR
jgi:hypothetical protein